jgi:hypothetical protein
LKGSQITENKLKTESVLKERVPSEGPTVKERPQIIAAEKDYNSEALSIDENFKQIIAFTSQMIKTLQITIPLMLSTHVEEEEEDYFDEDGESRMTPLKHNKSLLSKLNHQPKSSVDMGELLYPSFNQLVPKFVEHIIPNMAALSSVDSSTLLNTFYGMLQFAFKSPQIFEKRIHAILKASKIGF